MNGGPWLTVSLIAAVTCTTVFGLLGYSAFGTEPGGWAGALCGLAVSAIAEYTFRR